MADALPVISISAEAEGSSSSEDEEKRKADKTSLRMRRRHKKKTGGNQPAIALAVDEDGGGGGLTDVETVDVLEDEPAVQTPSSPAEDFTPIFDAVLKPQIVEIVDDADGKTSVKTLVKGVVAQLMDDDYSSDGGPSMSGEATDIESLGDQEDDEDSGSGGVPETSEMGQALQLAMELGGSVETHQEEKEGSSGGRPAAAAPPPPGPALLCPSTASGRRKPRKSRAKKKKAAAAAVTTSEGLLAVASPDANPDTDVESISGVEDFADPIVEIRSTAGVEAAGQLHPPPDEDGGGATDVEEFFSDDDGPSFGRLAPGIVVTREFSDTESAQGGSGRSSRVGHTDVESLSGMEEGGGGGGGLSLPQAESDPLTDVEDIDDVAEEDDGRPVPTLPPPNGPARAQHQVVTIQEDENGTVSSRKSARSPALLSVGGGPEDGGVSDVEFLGVSGDEEDGGQAAVVVGGMDRLLSPEMMEDLAGSTVRIKRHSLTTYDPSQIQAPPPQPSGGGGGLMPPAVQQDLLTDTEDMDMSEPESDPGGVWPAS